jgi:BlaI family transcriptional regulator, penicillinase repressor
MSDLPDLSPMELEILGILWNESPLKPADIEAALSRPIKNANLRAILSALLEKGVLRRELQGKAYFYKPVRASRTVRRSLVDRLASVFAQGSRVGLIAQLIRDEQLTPAQIRELQKLADKDHN